MLYWLYDYKPEVVLVKGHKLIMSVTLVQPKWNVKHNNSVFVSRIYYFSVVWRLDNKIATKHLNSKTWSWQSAAHFCENYKSQNAFLHLTNAADVITWRRGVCIVSPIFYLLHLFIYLSVWPESRQRYRVCLQSHVERNNQCGFNVSTKKQSRKYRTQ